MDLTAQDVERFWSKVDRRGPDECWPWTKGHDRHGYGRIKVAGKTLFAHRVAFIIGGGIITPERPHVLHGCDFPPCCNFERCLTAGTHPENIQQAWDRDRIRRVSRLTESDVRAIRQQHVDGLSLRAIADLWSMSATGVRDIVRRHRWAHVP